VLLAGSGNTAHVFDEFAPKLTDGCRVYAITRRGFGASSRPAGGYDDQRLADDVARAIEVASIQNPILVGHSMAGGELTTVARQHSDRLSGLVYLDAIGDLEDDPPADKETTFAAFRLSFACRTGFAFPESELRQQFAIVDGAVGQPTAPDWVMRAIGQGQAFRKDYSNIRVPALAMLERPRFPESYRPKSVEERALIDRFVARGNVIYDRWLAKLIEARRAEREDRRSPRRRPLLAHHARGGGVDRDTTVYRGHISHDSWLRG
jgi:pimeloyl-ACP methyl ester carboxylesterase